MIRANMQYFFYIFLSVKLKSFLANFSKGNATDHNNGPQRTTTDPEFG